MGNRAKNEIIIRCRFPRENKFWMTDTEVILPSAGGRGRGRVVKQVQSNMFSQMLQWRQRKLIEL